MTEWEGVNLREMLPADRNEAYRDCFKVHFKDQNVTENSIKGDLIS